MPATPADIARALRRATIVDVADPAIKAAYPQARDGLAAPATGYYDSAADAQVAMDARAALIGVARRRFAVEGAGLVWPDLSGGVPAWRLTDSEQDVDAAMRLARLEIDGETETTSWELYG